MIIKEYETSSMSAAHIAPKPLILVTTIMCRVLRFLRNIALRYARQSLLYEMLRIPLFG